MDARSHDTGHEPVSITILSPLAGWATPLGEVPDPVFAEKMLGDGIAIDPVEGMLVRGQTGVDVGDHIQVQLQRVDVDRGFIDFVR